MYFHRHDTKLNSLPLLGVFKVLTYDTKHKRKRVQYKTKTKYQIHPFLFLVLHFFNFLVISLFFILPRAVEFSETKLSKLVTALRTFKPWIFGFLVVPYSESYKIMLRVYWFLNMT